MLSPFQPIKNIQEIIPGRYGVMVKKGERRGLFLPQVWEETGWDRERFLEELCRTKAGIEPDFRPNADLEWFVFEVDSFEGPIEQELGGRF